MGNSPSTIEIPDIITIQDPPSSISSSSPPILLGFIPQIDRRMPVLLNRYLLPVVFIFGSKPPQGMLFFDNYHELNLMFIKSNFQNENIQQMTKQNLAHFVPPDMGLIPRCGQQKRKWRISGQFVESGQVIIGSIDPNKVKNKYNSFLKSIELDKSSFEPDKHLKLLIESNSTDEIDKIKSIKFVHPADSIDLHQKVPIEPDNEIDHNKKTDFDNEIKR